VVGRFVEDQHVVAGQENGRQRDAAAFATAEVVHRLVEGDLGQQMLDHGAGVGLGRPDVVRPAADDHVADGRLGGEVVGLMQVSDGKPRGVGHPARVRRASGGEDLQEGGLAVAVAPDDADRIALVHAQADAVQECAGAVADAHAFDVQEVGHQPSIIGGAAVSPTSQPSHRYQRARRTAVP
jgi:hypothetical protein